VRSAFFLLLGLAGAAHAQCVAQSGPGTAALVELYTSEGCSSCPPADRWLATIGKRHKPENMVPLALHVDYWDYIGWKDPYAKREFSVRQRRLSHLQRMAMVYTPQVVLQGRELRGWSSAGFDEAIARINAKPARAAIRLAILGSDGEGLDVEAQVEIPARTGDPALYLAVYEKGLSSRVTAGENRGRTLAHDYVVLAWQGPFGIPGPGRTERRRLALLPGAVEANSGVVAFVQDRGTLEVLQALLRSAC